GVHGAGHAPNSGRHDLRIDRTLDIGVVLLPRIRRVTETTWDGQVDFTLRLDLLRAFVGVARLLPEWAPLQVGRMPAVYNMSHQIIPLTAGPVRTLGRRSIGNL